MNMMKTVHKVNAKFLNTRLRQMLILLNHSLQATTFILHISMHLTLPKTTLASEIFNQQCNNKVYSKNELTNETTKRIENYKGVPKKITNNTMHPSNKNG